MRLSVINQLSKLQGKLLGYVAMMSYQHCQLCVKAEAASLLPIEMKVGSEDCKIEDMADLLLHEDEEENKDKMDLLPKHKEYIPYIVQGVYETHPEFKVSYMKYDENAEDSAENKYIRLTMPEVNKDRRDLILSAVDVLYNKCKIDMEACTTKSTAEITKLTINDEPSAIDEAKAKIEELKKQFNDLRDKLDEDKRKEVEEAYQRYLTKQESVEKQSESGENPFEGFGQSLNME